MGCSAPGALLGARWPWEHRLDVRAQAELAGDVQAALQRGYPLLHTGQAPLACFGRLPGGHEAAAIVLD